MNLKIHWLYNHGTFLVNNITHLYYFLFKCKSLNVSKKKKKIKNISSNIISLIENIPASYTIGAKNETEILNKVFFTLVKCILDITSNS